MTKEKIYKFRHTTYKSKEEYYLYWIARLSIILFLILGITGAIIDNLLLAIIASIFGILFLACFVVTA